MNDQPREEKAPQGADQPTVEQPTTPAETPAVPAQQPPAQPAAAAPGEPAAPAADQTAVLGQQPPAQPATPAAGGGQAPPTPQLSQPGPGQSYGAWGPPAAAPRQSGGFRRFVGHRATQLVAVGVLGLLVGGGIVGGIAAASHHGPRDGRPGMHRQYSGPQGFDGRGPGFRGGQGNNQGNNQGSGEGS
ncbi:hypothetical protein H4696_006538 [Amycolatopsis lexingtonensis]|uniref:Translation initiation factor IF-2 n=1 Tax=Amycolatopsis lexingtonensis TaxID=218822 RepID=A0ABR9I8B8_9PSEU|nr:hypothetical protein [Amycolatopsis lexingtonensis]MBE1499438.1 hypothetical protein [Amycolatopsis lexingtonensis]